MNETQKEALIEKLQTYFQTELDFELGQFDAGFLLDFLSETLAPHFYNQGLLDARAVLSGKLEEIDNQLLELEKPIPR